MPVWSPLPQLVDRDVLKVPTKTKKKVKFEGGGEGGYNRLALNLCFLVKILRAPPANHRDFFSLCCSGNVTLYCSVITDYITTVLCFSN
jgi:hypothetical protein